MFPFFLITVLCLGTHNLMAQRGSTTVKMALTDPATGQSSEYDLNNFTLNVAREEEQDSTGRNNRPFLRADASVTLVLSADKRILQWAADPAKALNGKVTVKSNLTGQTIQELTFAGTFIRNMSTVMSEDGYGGSYLQLYLQLGRNVVIDGVPFKLKNIE